MDAAAAAALVPGGAVAPSGPGIRIRVLRAFYWEGEVLPVGAEATIADAREARALVAWGKAEILPEAPATGPEAKPARRQPKEPAE